MKLDFWGDTNTLRKRSLWPVIEWHDDRWRFFRSWRGQHPHYDPRVFKRDDRLRYAPTGNHCIIQLRNYGRWTYRLPITKTHKKIPIYHFNYLTQKHGNGRDIEKDFKTVQYLDQHKIPKEMKLYELE